MNYQKAQSWNRANIEDGLWYAETETDKTALVNSGSLKFGDKIYVMSTQKVYMNGESQLYEM